MSQPMNVRVLVVFPILLRMTSLSMVAAESPYLLIRFTESYRDISVIGRRFAMFRELNGTNTCNINYWPYRKDETNAARIEAILSDALEKEATTSAEGHGGKSPKQKSFSLCRQLLFP